MGRASVPVLIHPEFWNRLVVLTGCGHAGIVNITRYARRLTSIEQVHRFGVQIALDGKHAPALARAGSQT